MSDNSTIEWTDATWNCLRGCTRVSQGCVNCYAEKVAHRFNGPGRPYEGLTTNGRWNGRIAVVEEHLADPLRWRRPRMVFVNSMSDLFHESIADETIDRIFAVMALAPQHTFQVLTKRPKRMRDYFDDLPYRTAQIGVDVERLGFSAFASGHGTAPAMTPRHPLPLPNVWLGISAENQAAADERVPLLLSTPAAVRWVSAEPLLGPIDFERPGRGWLTGHDDGDCPKSDPDCDGAEGDCHDACESQPRLDWVVVGGESGPAARVCSQRWIASIVGACQASCVPVFVKQLGRLVAFGEPGVNGGYQSKDRKGGDVAEWPPELRVREFPRAAGAR